MTILSPKKTYIDCIGLYLQKRTMNMEIRYNVNGLSD